jgi:hypothetical protein
VPPPPVSPSPPPFPASVALQPRASLSAPSQPFLPPLSAAERLRPIEVIQNSRPRSIFS